jgi:hypothetical protein
MKWILLITAASVGAALPFGLAMAITGKSLSAIIGIFDERPAHLILPFVLAAGSMMWSNDIAANRGVPGYRSITTYYGESDAIIPMWVKLCGSSIL